MNERIQILREAMTAQELSDAQSEHYVLDDHIRRMTGKLTAEQKRQVIEHMKNLCGSK